MHKVPQYSPQVTAVVQFLQHTFAQTHKENAVVAVSGGIDSAVSLTLLTKSLPLEQIWPILLPYGRQDMTDAAELLDFLHIPDQNRKILNISSMVDAVCKSLQINDTDQLRKGNVMARVRMMTIFDYAKNKSALVVGTENKSEHYLGYFTRFGDAASDVEPLLRFYKTQIRQLAQELDLPAVFVQKAPSAGLWENQSDEQELGFSYELADRVLICLVDQHMTVKQTLDCFAPEDHDLVKKVIKKFEEMAFKLEVPYSLD